MPVMWHGGAEAGILAVGGFLRNANLDTGNETVIQTDAATARRANRSLLVYAVVFWLVYALHQLPLPAVAPLLKAISVGCFVSAFMGSTLFSGVALYGAARYRYGGYFFTATMLLPLTVICWYELAYLPAW